MGLSCSPHMGGALMNCWKLDFKESFSSLSMQTPRWGGGCFLLCGSQTSGQSSAGLCPAHLAPRGAWGALPWGAGRHPVQLQRVTRWFWRPVGDTILEITALVSSLQLAFSVRWGWMNPSSFPSSRLGEVGLSPRALWAQCCLNSLHFSSLWPISP